MLVDIAASADAPVKMARPMTNRRRASGAVAERGAGEQEDRERQGVGVDGPLELLERGAEVHVDGRERGGHDEVVEHHHEQGDGRHHERPERVGARLHGRVPFSGPRVGCGWRERSDRDGIGRGRRVYRRSGFLGHATLFEAWSAHYSYILGRFQDVHRRHDVEQHAHWTHEGGRR